MKPMSRIFSIALLAASCFLIGGCVPPDDGTDTNTTFGPTPKSPSGNTTSPKRPGRRPQSNTTSAGVPRNESDDIATTTKKDEAEATAPPKTKAAASGKPRKVTFDALIVGMQEDVVYRPFMMTPESKALHDQVIQIPGYMFGGVDKLEGLTELILLRNKECKFGPGGQADHLIKVKLKPGLKTDRTEDMMYVQGTLEFKPTQGPDGNTWSIYEINDGRVVRGSRF